MGDARHTGLAGDGPILFGVAARIAARLNLDVVVVRLAIAGACLAVPPLVAVYLLVATVARAIPPTPPPRLRGADTQAPAAALGVVLAEVGLVGLASRTGLAMAWPLVVAVLAVQVPLTLAWRRLEGMPRWSWLLHPGAAGDRRGRWGAVRVVAGVALCLLAVQLARDGVSLRRLAQAREVLWPALALMAGVGLLLLPPLLRLGTEVSGERRDRIRADERARLAAHLHDSVLQTLTLIQRTGDPADMATLARAQERDLRDWLYGDAAPEARGRLRDRLAALAGEVEDRYRWRVELVVVGDRDVGPAEEELLAAAREAVVNAARHSGAPGCDVFAECRQDAVAVFVRDRGRGFDPAGVAGDRRGLADSVVGRMRRLGGSATVRSTPGGGTEVALTLPVVRDGVAA